VIQVLAGWLADLGTEKSEGPWREAALHDQTLGENRFSLQISFQDFKEEMLQTYIV